MLELMKTITGIKSEPSASPKKKLDEIDVKKLAINTAIVGLSASLTFLAEYVKIIDLGQYNVFVVPVLSALMVAYQKWAKDNTPAV